MHFWWHFFLLKPKANASNLGAALAGLLPSARGLPWCGIHRGSRGLCLSSPEHEGTMSWSALLVPCPARVCTQDSTRRSQGLFRHLAPVCVTVWLDLTSLAGARAWFCSRHCSEPLRAGLLLCNSILTTKQPLLQVPHSFSKHIQAFSSPDRGQSCGRGLWAGANCKSISLTSSLLKKLDIRALATANLLLSPPPEKWIILMLTEGFSFFKSCQI